MSSLLYKNYNSDQIALELDRVQYRVNNLHGSLKKKADDDSAQMAVGMIFSGRRRSS